MRYTSLSAFRQAALRAGLIVEQEQSDPYADLRSAYRSEGSRRFPKKQHDRMSWQAAAKLGGNPCADLEEVKARAV